MHLLALLGLRNKMEKVWEPNELSKHQRADCINITFSVTHSLP